MEWLDTVLGSSHRFIGSICADNKLDILRNTYQEIGSDICEHLLVLLWSQQLQQRGEGWSTWTLLMCHVAAQPSLRFTLLIEQRRSQIKNPSIGESIKFYPLFFSYFVLTALLVVNVFCICILSLKMSRTLTFNIELELCIAHICTDLETVARISKHFAS